MAGSGKVHLALAGATAIVTAGIAWFTLVEANLDHLTSASGILTMQECLECHEASARPVSICLDDHCLYTKNHSLMHTYPPPGRETEYASKAEIEQAGCVLEGGKVTCLSCHDLTKPPPHLIREGDELCYICHLALRSQF